MSIETKPPTGADLRAEIDRLRKERKAMILAHYYQTVSYTHLTLPTTSRV